MNEKTLRARRAWLALGLAALASAAVPASAADHRYAVLSLVGDQVATVSWRPSVGSNIDRNERYVVNFKDGALDKMVLLAVDDAMRRARPAAAATLLAARDPQWYRLQDRMLEQGGEADELLTALRGLLAQTQADRLILVTKHRADARFALQDMTVGTGKISGVGFYLDEEMRVQLVETGNTNTGYIAPYAYVAISLVEVPSMKPIRRVTATESRTVPTAASKTATRPWDALSPSEKADNLDRLIRQAVNRALPELLAAE